LDTRPTQAAKPALSEIDDIAQSRRSVRVLLLDGPHALPILKSPDLIQKESFMKIIVW
jgi:hypothetical protein